MNLHAIVSPMIVAVNPLIPLVIRVNTGSTLGAGGKRTPTYAAAITRPGQVQPISFKDITQLDGLNIGGVRRAIYINGLVNGLVRSENKGGDLIEVTAGPNAGNYLVALVAEAWPDWCKVLATLQND